LPLVRKRARIVTSLSLVGEVRESVAMTKLLGLL
jgi:hypothetical protein